MGPTDTIKEGNIVTVSYTSIQCSEVVTYYYEGKGLSFHIRSNLLMERMPGIVHLSCRGFKTDNSSLLGNSDSTIANTKYY